MILRFVVGLKVVCPGFATTGVSTESRLLVQEPEVGDETLALLCKGVAGESTELDSSATDAIDAVEDAVRGASVKLTSEDGLGDSGFEGCASNLNK